MAPPRRPPNTKRDRWHLSGYDPEKFDVQYELMYGKDLIRAGDRIKIKYSRNAFLFRCVVHNIEEDVTWFDCLSNLGISSFRMNMLMGPVKKKSRRRKNND